MKRDTFYADEVNIFKGVQRWITKNPKIDSAKVLDLVRLPLMQFTELFSTVKESGLVSNEQLLQAIETKTTNLCTTRQNIYFDEDFVSDFGDAYASDSSSFPYFGSDTGTENSDSDFNFF